MRERLLLLLCFLLWMETSLAQNRAEVAKFELIRETIDFLATDRAVSQDTSFRISCVLPEFDCIAEELAAKQPIAGIGQWYDRWRAMPVTDSAELVALKNRILGDVVERSGKGYRKQLAGYDGYVDRINTLIDHFAQGAAIRSVASSTDEVTEGSVPAKLSDEDRWADTDPVSSALRHNVQQDSPLKTENSMMLYLALGLGVGALIIAILTLLQLRKLQHSNELESLTARMAELSRQVDRLERRLGDSQHKEAVSHLTEIMEKIEKRVVVLERPDSGNPSKRDISK